MLSLISNLLADFNLSADDIVIIRVVSMFVVLTGGVGAGYLASSRFGVSEDLAKKVMTIVLTVFSWSTTLLIMWQMELTKGLVWIPVIGVVVLLTMTTFSYVFFGLHKLDAKSRLTMTLAGGLSNLSYTGGAFVCYAFFGIAGLGPAQLYLAIWLPIVFLFFIPLLKVIELRGRNESGTGLMGLVLDKRMLIVPAVIVGIVLNLAQIKMPVFITKFHFLDALVYVASSLSFFAIGLRLRLHRLKNYIRLYFSLGAVKFILTPAVAMLLLWLLSLANWQMSPLAKKVIIVQSFAPSAIIMVTFSNVFDLDARLGSALWVVNTGVFAAIIVPILFFVFT